MDPGTIEVSRDYSASRDSVNDWTNVWVDDGHPLRFSNKAMDEFTEVLMEIMEPMNDELSINWNNGDGWFSYHWSWWGEPTIVDYVHRSSRDIGALLEAMTDTLVLYKTDPHTSIDVKGTHLIVDIISHFGEKYAKEFWGVMLYQNLFDYFRREYPRECYSKDEALWQAYYCGVDPKFPSPIGSDLSNPVISELTLDELGIGEQYWKDLEREIVLVCHEQGKGIEVIRGLQYEIPGESSSILNDCETLIKCCLIWPETFIDVYGRGDLDVETLRDPGFIPASMGHYQDGDESHECVFIEKAIIWESQTKKEAHESVWWYGESDSHSKAVVGFSTCKCGKSKLSAQVQGSEEPVHSVIADSSEGIAVGLMECVTAIVQNEMPFHKKEADFIAGAMLRTISPEDPSWVPALKEMSNKNRATKHRLGKTLVKFGKFMEYWADLDKALLTFFQRADGSYEKPLEAVSRGISDMKQYARAPEAGQGLQNG